MAAPTLQGSSLTAYGSSTTTTPTLPSHQADDILIVSAGQRNATGTHTASGSWAKITENNTGGIGKTSWWWLRAASGAESNPTITSTVSSDFYSQAHVIRGCITSGNPWDVFEAYGFSTTDPNTISGSSITTTVVDTLIAVFGVELDNIVTSVVVTAATDPTTIGTASSTDNRYDVDPGGADGGTFGIAAAKATAGSTGDFTLNWSAAPDGGNVLFIAFKPPVAAPGPAFPLRHAGRTALQRR